LPHFSPHEERVLLNQIADDDEHSFRVIFDHYRPKIYNYALHLTESETLADEVIQEVFMKLWLNRKKLESVEKFNAWLHAIARNAAFDAFKQIALQKNGTAKLIDITPVSVSDTDNWLLDKENTKWLNNALEQLTPSQKQVYILSRRHGMKAAQIAKELNIAENTVKKHLVNSLHTLRTYIKKHDMIMLIIAAETAVS